jgi:hypothetical protein
LEVGAAGEGNNWDHSFSAFGAVRYPIHEILPIISPTTVAEPAERSQEHGHGPLMIFWLGANGDRAGHVIGENATHSNIAPELEAIPATFSRGHPIGGLFHFSGTEAPRLSAGCR